MWKCLWRKLQFWWNYLRWADWPASWVVVYPDKLITHTVYRDTAESLVRQYGGEMKYARDYQGNLLPGDVLCPECNNAWRAEDADDEQNRKLAQ